MGMEKPKNKNVRKTQLSSRKVSFAKSAHLAQFIYKLAVKLNLTQKALMDDVSFHEMCQRFHEYAFNQHNTFDPATFKSASNAEQIKAIKGVVSLMAEKIGLYNGEQMAKIFAMMDTYEKRMTSGEYFRNRMFKEIES